MTAGGPDPRGIGGTTIGLLLLVVALLAGAGTVMLSAAFGAFDDPSSSMDAQPATAMAAASVVAGPVTPDVTPTPQPTPVPVAGWQKLAWTGAGPTSRRDMAVQASSDGSRLLVYGGISDDAPVKDTWLFDTTTSSWSRLSPDAPAPHGRFGVGLTLDLQRNRAVLFGGQSGTTLYNDVWYFDFRENRWVQTATVGRSAPEARFGAGFAYDARGDRYVLTHGKGARDTLYDDTWAFSPVSNSWTDLSPVPLGTPAPQPTATRTPSPTPTATPTRTPTPAPGTTPLPAPSTTPAPTATPLLATATAAPRVATRPPKQAFGQLVADGLTGNLYLLGGDTGGGAASDVWSFDLVGNRWTPVRVEGAGPLPRSEFAAASLPNGRLALFGGSRGSERFGDVWFFETRSNQWRSSPLSGPQPRSGAEMSYDARGDRLWLFGGRDARSELADLWLLENASLAPGPAER